MARLSHAHTDRAAALSTLEGEGLFVVEWTDGADVYYPEHSHANAEVRWLLEGTMTVGTRDGATHALGPGDRIDMAPGEAHWATVGPEGVRYLAGT